MPDSGQTDIIKDIARGIALTLLIFVVSIYIPVFGFFFSLFIPLPVLFARMKLGRQAGAAVPVISALIMTGLIGGASFDTVFFAELLLLGFMMGELFERNLSVEKTVGYTAAVVL
ncbi:MAG: DUF2232 domain-containing protein, partial [Thermodesulfobacteriota bacterium]